MLFFTAMYGGTVYVVFEIKIHMGCLSKAFFFVVTCFPVAALRACAFGFSAALSKSPLDFSSSNVANDTGLCYKFKKN